MPRGRNGTMQDVIIHKESKFNVTMFLDKHKHCNDIMQSQHAMIMRRPR